MTSEMIKTLIATRIEELKKEFPCVMEDLRIKVVNCGRSMFHICCGKGMVRARIEVDRNPVPDELVCVDCGRHFKGNTT